MKNNTQNAGTASVMDDHSILFTFLNNSTPTKSNRGVVAAAGIASNKGAKKLDMQNRKPHTIVLRPVFAPALIPAALSGDKRIGGPLYNPK